MNDMFLKYGLGTKCVLNNFKLNTCAFHPAAPKATQSVVHAYQLIDTNLGTIGWSYKIMCFEIHHPHHA